MHAYPDPSSWARPRIQSHDRYVIGLWILTFVRMTDRVSGRQSSTIWLFVRVSFMRRYTTSDTAIIAVTYQ